MVFQQQQQLLLLRQMSPSQWTEDAAADPAGEPQVSISAAEKLTGHDNEVFICAWSPSQLLLASG